MAAVLLKREIEKHGCQISEQTRLQQASVRIPGHQHGLSRLCDGKQCGLQQPCGTVHAKPSVAGADGPCGSLLSNRNGPLLFQRSADGRQFR